LHGGKQALWSSKGRACNDLILRLAGRSGMPACGSDQKSERTRSGTFRVDTISQP